MNEHRRLQENAGLITEISLSRVISHFKNKDIPVGIISAFRDENPYNKNVGLNKELASKFKSSGYGYVFVDGAWMESQEDGTTKEVSETSILVIGNTGDNDALGHLLEKYTKEYHQDASMFKPEL